MLSSLRSFFFPLLEMCVPCATGPICSADGEGGGEGGKLAESSTAKGERERQTHLVDETWMGGRT